MTNYRDGNYCAFYVKEPFTETGNLRVFAAHDYVYYNMLSTWKAMDSSLPFVDSHNKTYNVRDDSDWETTLKPRLHKRLRKSKNIILFLSSITKSSKALKEEINYGIITLGLPVIVVYPDYNDNSDIVDCNGIKSSIRALWDNLPIFRDNMGKVPTLHIPMKKSLIISGLNDTDLMVQSKTLPSAYYY